MTRIDSHLHVFAKVSPEFPREPTPVCPADREETAEKLLCEMEANGIDQAVLVQIGGNEMKHHAYLLRCLRTYPDRFLGIGLIPPELSAPEDHMDRLADGTGIIGFRISSLRGPRDPLVPVDIEDIKTYRIWKHAAEKDYVLWLYLRAIDAHVLPYLIDAFPQVRIVMNHLSIYPGKGKFSWDAKGRPRVELGTFPPALPTAQKTAILQKQGIYTGLYLGSFFSNLMVLASGQYAFSDEPYPYKDLMYRHEELAKHYTTKRMMWGTDFPWILDDPGYGQLTGIIKELLPDLDNSEYDDIMGGNAKRFLRFPDRAR